MAVMAKRSLDYLTLFFVSTAILLLAITPTSGGETPSAAPTVQECRGHIENALKEFIVHQGPEDITPISATVAASSEDSASGEAETHSTQSQSSESQSESSESKDESQEGAPGSKESGSSESGSSESGSSESKEDEDKVKSGEDDSHSKEDGKDNTSEEGDSKDSSEEGHTKEGKDDTSEEGNSKESKEDTSEEGVTKKSADDSSEEGNTKEDKDDSKSDESSEEGDTKKDKDDSKSDESSEEGVTKGGEDDSSEESKESKGESSSEESKESKGESSSEEGTKEGKDDSSEEETKDSKNESSEESDSKSDESVEVGAAVGKVVEGGSESSEESGSKDDDSKESSEEHKEGKSDEDGKEKDSSEEEKAGDKDESDESSEEKAKADSESGESDESGEAKEHEGTDESESDEHEESEEEEEVKREPIELRSRTHVDQILGLDDETMTSTIAAEKPVQITLRELKKMYESAVKPMEVLYKFKDISNRFVGDAEIFSKPMILFIGPWSSGKSSIINYLMDTEDTTAALKTGAEPQSNGFTVLMYGETEQTMDGIEIAADWTFSTLQKFGQSFMDKLQGLRLPNNLLRKVTIVDTPGIIENRKQLDRAYPFNDACQWFIDRADIIYIVFDPTKLDMGLEMEALFDQLKGRESQARIVLNKADTVSPQELMKVQSTLLWNLSPLLGSSEPPTIFVGSFRSHQFLPGSPTTLFLAQESALLQDLRQTIDGRVENKISFTRRHAVRVRNHAKMVDCYLNTYYNHKTFFSNKKKIADEIIENPQNYHIYEGLSTLTNISRYDLPDPDIYRDFFKVNPLYDFKLLASTCSYFKGCPLDKLDLAIAYELPELMGKYRKIVGFGMEGKR